ncbi:MAG: hypothetical protein WCF05_11755 [Chromatiaceae bacterium]
MFSKIFLTLAVILGIYWVIRARLRGGGPTPGRQSPPQPPLIPLARVRALAYGLLVATVTGSLLWLYWDWEAGRGVVSVQVINANTGAIVIYQARRADVAGRHFTTLDGRQVVLAEVERLVLE